MVFNEGLERSKKVRRQRLQGLSEFPFPLHVQEVQEQAVPGKAALFIRAD
jgi:hypothetical protein